MRNLIFGFIFIPTFLFAQNSYIKVRQQLELNYDKVGAFHKGGNVIVSNKEKYGLVSRQGEAITPCIYEEIKPFYKGLAAVKKDKKWGFVDTLGQVRIPFEYDAVNAGFYLPLAFVKKGDFWGGITPMGEIKLSFEYDLIEDALLKVNQEKYGYYNVQNHDALVFKQEKKLPNYYFARKGAAWGMFDFEGNVLIPCQYLDYQLLDNYIRMGNAKQCALFDTQGNQLSPFYLEIRTASKPNYFEVTTAHGRGLWHLVRGEIIPPTFSSLHIDLPVIWVAQDNKWSLRDSNFRTILPIEYDDFVENGRFFITKNVKMPSSKSPNITYKEEKESFDGGFTEEEEEQVDEWGFEADFGDERSNSFDWGFGDVYDYGLLDSTGKQLFSCEYVDVQIYENRYVVLRDSFQRYAVWDAVISDFLYPFQAKYQFYEVNSQGVIASILAKSDTLKRDTLQTETDIVPTEAGIIKPYCSADILPMDIAISLLNTYSYGMLDHKGNILIPFLYTRPIKMRNKGFLEFDNGEAVGKMDYKGKIIFPPLYNNYQKMTYLTAKKQQHYVYKVKNKEGLYGFVNPNGKQIVPCKYVSINPYAHKICLIENEEELYGLMDFNGKIMVPCIYMYYKYDENAGLLVFDNETNHCIYDTLGNLKLSIAPKKEVWKNNQNRLVYTLNAKKEIVFWEKEKGKWYAKQANGNLFFAQSFDEISYDNEARAYFATAYTPDSQTNQIICLFDSHKLFRWKYVPQRDTIFLKNGQRLRTAENQWYWEDVTGRLLLPNSYQEIKRDANIDLYIVKKAAIEALIDSSFRHISSPNCEEIVLANKGFFFKQKGLWGFCDLQGKIKLSAQFTQIEYKYTNRNQYIVEKYGKKGVIDLDGNALISPQYEYVNEINASFFFARKGGFTGVVDRNGKEIRPFIFDNRATGIEGLGSSKNVRQYYEGYNWGGNLLILSLHGKPCLVDLPKASLYMTIF